MTCGLICVDLLQHLVNLEERIRRWAQRHVGRQSSLDRLAYSLR
jgi:hypothetical protein